MWAQVGLGRLDAGFGKSENAKDGSVYLARHRPGTSGEKRFLLLSFSQPHPLTSFSRSQNRKVRLSPKLSPPEQHEAPPPKGRIVIV